MYTFSELLTIFFHLQKYHADIQTQGEFATAIESSRRTVAGWFAGDYAPRSADKIEQIAHLLCLTPLQTDLLLFSVNSEWIKYGTPRAKLESAKIIRYLEEDIFHESYQVEPPPQYRKSKMSGALFLTKHLKQTINVGARASSRTGCAA